MFRLIAARGLTGKAPKSAAGVRTVAFPASLAEELAHHLAEYADAGRTGLVFVGAAATGAASSRELTHRMGHASVPAALTSQHLVNGRDHVIADYVDGQIRKVKRPPHGPSGT
ncbi:hypothetical protein [Streptomyces sp. NBC_00063]|uniref:hypothetical protein n=1 Tax=Streptomyces sp. NBC_00063 TaxID=2975638 RepID=UPI003D744090